MSLIALVSQAGCGSTGSLRNQSDLVRELPALRPATDPGVTQASQSPAKAAQTATIRQTSGEIPASSQPSTNAGYLIDLPTALALAGNANPTIGFARELVNAADAERLEADALLLPTLRVGADVNVHRGNLMSSRGRVFDVDRQSAYVGAGTAAVGGGTVNVPGIRVFAHIAEALYEPLAARQRLTAINLDADATNIAILRDVGVQYYELLGAEARLVAVQQSEADLQLLVRQTADFARTGQGRNSDAERAASEAQLLRGVEQRVEEEVSVAAAELARLLSLDPSCQLHSTGEPLRLVESSSSVDSLEACISRALSNRPEIAARAAEIGETETRLREERMRPFVPLLSIGYSAGGFGGGSDATDSRFGSLTGRSDFDVSAVWSLGNLGIGNRATVRIRRAERSQAEAERQQSMDAVRREVAEAYGELLARRQEVEAARRQLRSAEDAFRADLRRSQNMEGLPIEVLNSVNLLTNARLAAIRGVVEHNQAQIRLIAAQGQLPLGSDSR